MIKMIKTYKQAYLEDQLETFFDPHTCYERDRTLIFKINHYIGDINKFLAYLYESSIKRFIERNINTHVYLALYYLPCCKSNEKFVYDVFIQGINYFRGYFQFGLINTYSCILNDYTFTSKHLSTLLIRLFRYVFRFIRCPLNKEILSLDKLDNKTKFILWYLSKHYNTFGTTFIFNDLLNNYQQLNKFEKRMIRKYAADYFLSLYLNFHDQINIKNIYKNVIKFCPEEETKINLSLFSLL